MGEEVQLEALAQHFVGHVGDPAGQGHAGVGDHDVDPSEASRDRGEGRVHRRGVGQVALQGQDAAPGARRRRPGRLAVEIEHRHLGALRGEGPGDGRPDRPAAAGDHDHLARQALFDRLAQLGLLQRPVFHVEGVGLAYGFEAAHRLGVEQGLGPVLSDVGGDGGVRRTLANADQTQARDGDHPGQGVQRRLDAA